MWHELDDESLAWWFALSYAERARLLQRYPEPGLLERWVRIWSGQIGREHTRRLGEAFTATVLALQSASQAVRKFHTALARASSFTVQKRKREEPKQIPVRPQNPPLWLNRLRYLNRPLAIRRRWRFA